jgi:maltooligosyltrehalose synthase
MPLGERVWGSTHLSLPRPAPTVWTNVLTRESVEIDGGRLLLADAFARLPVAMLAAGMPLE